MFWRKSVCWLSTALLVLLLSGCGPCMMHRKNCGDGCQKQTGQSAPCMKTEQGVAPCMKMQGADTARMDVLHNCNCGCACCNTVSAQAAECKCGMPVKKAE